MEFRATSYQPKLLTSAAESEDLTAKQSNKSQRAEGVEVETPTSTTPYLNKLPEDVIERLIAKWLGLPERMLLSRCNWFHSRQIGNRPIFARVLVASGLGDPDPVMPCARRIGRAMLGGDRLVMSKMADALCSSKLFGPRRTIVTTLFQQSIADPAHPMCNQLETARLTSLWMRQWMGQPPTVESDSTLWSIRLVKIITSGLSATETARLNLEVYKRSVLGYCSTAMMSRAHTNVTAIEANNSLPVGYRKSAEVVRDLISYFIAPSAPAKLAAWMTWRGHLSTVEGRRGIETLGLARFVYLLDHQHFLFTSSPTLMPML